MNNIEIITVCRAHVSRSFGGTAAGHGSFNYMAGESRYYFNVRHTGCRYQRPNTFYHDSFVRRTVSHRHGQEECLHTRRNSPPVVIESLYHFPRLLFVSQFRCFFFLLYRFIPSAAKSPRGDCFLSFPSELNRGKEIDRMPLT